MAWPTSDEVKLWCAPDGKLPTSQDGLVDDCYAAAKDYLVKHTTAELDEDPSESVRQACRMIVARLFRRKQSPDGVAAFGDNAVRVYTVDADVREMLAADWVYGIAAPTRTT